MAFQFSEAARNAAVDAIETAVGASPTLEIRSGAPPAAAADVDSGTVLATIALPADWLSTAAAGSKSLLGVWQDTSADATGTAGHFRIKAGVTTHIQGTATATGGGGDMQLSAVAITAGELIDITAFTLAAGGA